MILPTLTAQGGTGFLQPQAPPGLAGHTTFGHFSRVVQPGAQRILCAATRERLEVTAFRNPDGRVALIALHRSDEALPFAMGSELGWAQSELPGHSMATYGC